MKRRRRLEQTTSLRDRIVSFAKAVREKASRLPPGPERDALLKKAKKADAVTQSEAWVNSYGLWPPK